MPSPMMTCGHEANGVRVVSDGEDIPACVICSCTEVAESEPNLEGRMARCGGAQLRKKCRGPIPSAKGLAFFGHRPDAEFDSYYCGCDGWD